jgi:glycosyltransferase involved in cell wall biosynthesis
MSAANLSPTGKEERLRGDGSVRQPRVSIGVPVFNGARHLATCLDSLLAQTYDDLEIVVSDNASTDDTAAICGAYSQHDERIRYIRQGKNVGAAANYNLLVRRATGELFKWAAHDDVCAPELIERCVDALDRSPRDVLAFPKTGFIDDGGQPLSGYEAPIIWTNQPLAFDRLGEHLAVPQASLHHLCTRQFGLIRRESLLKTGLIRSHPASDLVLLLELALIGGFAAVDERLFWYRVHASSSMQANTSAADLAQWYDPRAGKRYPLKWTRVFTGYSAVILNSALPARHKAVAALLMGRWLLSDENWRIIGGELKRRARGSIPDLGRFDDLLGARVSSNREGACTHAR